MCMLVYRIYVLYVHSSVHGSMFSSIETVELSFAFQFFFSFEDFPLLLSP